jgi:hypothetical protein
VGVNLYGGRFAMDHDKGWTTKDAIYTVNYKRPVCTYNDSDQLSTEFQSLRDNVEAALRYVNEIAEFTDMRPVLKRLNSVMDSIQAISGNYSGYHEKKVDGWWIPKDVPLDED